MQDNNLNNRFADDLQQELADGGVLDWAEVYALDAVSEEERHTIEVYISGTDPDERNRFEQRVRTARETITRAYAVADVEPPAGLFDRIMDRLPAAPVTDARTSAAPVSAGLPPSAPGDELGRHREAKERRTSPIAKWLVGAAAAIVIAVGGVTVAQNFQEASLEQEVLQASDVQRENIRIPAGGTADLALSRSEDAAVVTLSGVPAPPDGKVYQMWRVPSDGSAPLSIGTMTGEDVAGTKVTTVEGIESFRGLAITVEPAGGSEEPTLPAVAQIPFDA